MSSTLSYRRIDLIHVHTSRCRVQVLLSDSSDSGHAELSWYLRPFRKGADMMNDMINDDMINDVICDSESFLSRRRDNRSSADIKT